MRAAGLVALAWFAPAVALAQAPSPRVELRECAPLEAEVLGAALQLELTDLESDDGDAAITVAILCETNQLVVSTDVDGSCGFQDEIPRGEATTRAAALAAAEQVSACREILSAPPPPPPPAPRPTPAGGFGMRFMADVLGPVYATQPWLLGLTVGGSFRAGRGQLSVAASYWGGRRDVASGNAVLHVVSMRVAGGAALHLGAHANLELLVGVRVGDAVLAGRRTGDATQGSTYHTFWASPAAVVGVEFTFARLSLPIELEGGFSPRRAIGSDVDGRTVLRWGGAWARFAVGVRL